MADRAPSDPGRCCSSSGTGVAAARSRAAMAVDPYDDGGIPMSQDVRHVCPPTIIASTYRQTCPMPSVPVFPSDLDHHLLKHIEKRPRPLSQRIKEYTPPSLSRLLRFAPPKPTAEPPLSSSSGADSAGVAPVPREALRALRSISNRDVPSRCPRKRPRADNGNPLPFSPVHIRRSSRLSHFAAASKAKHHRDGNRPPDPAAVDRPVSPNR